MMERVKETLSYLVCGVSQKAVAREEEARCARKLNADHGDGGRREGLGWEGLKDWVCAARPTISREGSEHEWELWD